MTDWLGSCWPFNATRGFLREILREILRLDWTLSCQSGKRATLVQDLFVPANIEQRPIHLLYLNSPSWTKEYSSFSCCQGARGRRRFHRHIYILKEEIYNPLLMYVRLLYCIVLYCTYMYIRSWKKEKKIRASPEWERIEHVSPHACIVLYNTYFYGKLKGN